MAPVVVLGLVVVVQQVQGDLLGPLVMGRALRLHPFVILVALAVAAVAAGLLGVFLAVPLTGVAVAAITAIRQPHRTWVALVDGNNHQIDRIHAEAMTRSVSVTIVVDLIRVIEYLWGAVWCFFTDADPNAEAWVRDRTIAVLEGNARDVAAGIRRRATKLGVAASMRKKADACATYPSGAVRYSGPPTGRSRSAEDCSSLGQLAVR